MSDKPVTNPVPVLSSINQVVSDPKRFDELRDKFVRTFGVEPDFYVRAPGRVNLIGEHVDYSGYGVLPMAVERDNVIAVKLQPGTKEIHFANFEAKFGPKQWSKELKDINIDVKNHDWTNYVLCGYKGVLENKLASVESPIAFSALMHGTVPKGSGLSSSSAVVCASALATMYANGISLSKNDMAELAAACETYVGVQSGGMDQAISFLGEKGQASRIDFNPIRAAPVKLPDNAVFFVANSLVESNKYQTADTNYNMRVVECRLGAVMLAKKLGLEWQSVRRLVDVQKQSNKTLPELAQAVQQLLHKEPYTREEVAKELGISVDEVSQKYVDPVKSNEFYLYQRSLHVYMESSLVDEFAAVCAKPSYQSQINDLGELMNKSHYSCRDNFSCSCPELDTLTEICRKAGALGSRLTGAGWGGCTVSLVPKDKQETFFNTVRDEYYAKYRPQALEHIEDVLFATQPGQGAFVYIPEKDI
jgi:N-acetylgalactosamine kinase